MSFLLTFILQQWAAADHGAMGTQLLPNRQLHKNSPPSIGTAVIHAIYAVHPDAPARGPVEPSMGSIFIHSDAPFIHSDAFTASA
jgi:hypothetical protein